jgi:flagellar L-ring protein precursor FlgH
VRTGARRSLWGTGQSSPVGEVSAADKQKFKGDGTYTRNDRVTAKITATVIDVKPNGLMVLEARKTITTNGETKTIVLSGTCRREDVTSANTVLSSQLANLAIVQNTDGDLKDSASKGWITRVLEAVFSF